jgi:hypothetical protein
LWHMSIFRKSFLKTLFLILTGVTFLNMSFILAELQAVGVARDSAVVQNFINTGLEEEKETSSETETDSETEFLFSLHHHADHGIELYTGSILKSTLDAHKDVHKGYLTRFSPPPEA